MLSLLQLGAPAATPVATLAADGGFPAAPSTTTRWSAYMHGLGRTVRLGLQSRLPGALSPPTRQASGPQAPC